MEPVLSHALLKNHCHPQLNELMYQQWTCSCLEFLWTHFYVICTHIGHTFNFHLSMYVGASKSAHGHIRTSVSLGVKVLCILHWHSRAHLEYAKLVSLSAQLGTVCSLFRCWLPIAYSWQGLGASWNHRVKVLVPVVSDVNPLSLMFKLETVVCLCRPRLYFSSPPVLLVFKLGENDH